jgi:signal-transduction protein with cAMP-binding, CBS, and nucleotidyltransferase domain
MDTIPVLDSSSKVVGIISDQDVMSTLITHKTGAQSIGDMVLGTAVCYEHTASAEEVARFLCRVSLARVLVVCDGNPMGVISRSHLLRWLHHVTSLGDLPKHNLKPTFAKPVQLDLAADALYDSARRLSNAGYESQEELTSCIIGEATRVQELFEQLLSQFTGIDCSKGEAQAMVSGARSFL